MIAAKYNYCIVPPIIRIIILSIMLIAMLSIDRVWAAVISTEAFPSCEMKLEGDIDKFTDRDIKTSYAKLLHDRNELLPTLPCKQFGIYLYLDSNGGDVEAAIRAGDFIREKEMKTEIGINDSCASACVLLYIAGVERYYMRGKIGLHRPYSNTYSNSNADAKRTYDVINRKIMEYLKRMNISESLLNIMNSVPPSEIKWLSEKDWNKLEELQIVGEDPIYADKRDSEEAKEYGLDKKEYYARRSRAREVCKDIKGGPFGIGNRAKCESEVMAGIR